jgi:hypothetical protein
MPASRAIATGEGTEVPVSVLKIEQREEMLWISSDPIGEERFPPCIRNIIPKDGTKSGQHRKAAILAAFLGQVGWKEPQAKELWQKATSVEERIFSEWFSKLHCPKCETLKKQSRGYPDLGIGDLGLCCPDDRCPKFLGPVEYAAGIRCEEDRFSGKIHHIKTLFRVQVFDWLSGREEWIELNRDERDDLEGLLNELKDRSDMAMIYTRVRSRGRLRPKFLIRERAGPKRQMLSELL